MSEVAYPSSARSKSDSSLTETIRIETYFDPKTISTSNQLTNDQIDYIHQITSAAVTFYESFTKVIPVSSPLYYWSCNEWDISSSITKCYSYHTKCGQATIPLDHIHPDLGLLYKSPTDTTPSQIFSSGHGIADSDVIIYVSYDDTTIECQNGELAHSVYCAQDQYGRPYAGNINLCSSMIPGSSKTDEVMLEQNVMTIENEMANMLIMDKNLWSDFGSFYGISDVLDTTNPMNDGLEYIITPKVKEISRKHFNCPSLPGAPLQKSSNHWDERLLSSSQNIAGSILTFALMEDSGWYYVDYNFASPIQKGDGAGCEWFDDDEPFRRVLVDGCPVDEKYVATAGQFDTWEGARQECEDNGMVLAAFDTADELQQINVICDQTGFAICWLGFYDAENDGSYAFIDDGDSLDNNANYWCSADGPSGGGYVEFSCGIVESNPFDPACITDFWCIQAPFLPAVCQCIETTITTQEPTTEPTNEPTMEPTTEPTVNVDITIIDCIFVDIPPIPATPIQSGWTILYGTTGPIITDDYHGPYTRSNAGVTNAIYRQFSCLQAGKVHVSFYVGFCKSGGNDYVTLSLNDVKQVKIRGNSHGMTKMPVDSLYTASGCFRWKWLQTGPYDISYVEAGQVFKVEFEWYLSDRNDVLAISGVEIKCDAQRKPGSKGSP